MAKRSRAAKEEAVVELVGGEAPRTTRPRPPVRLVHPGRPAAPGDSESGAASVFISYSRLDQLVCDQIVRELKERGHRVWLDREAIHGGDVWRANIEKGIRAADVFVILLSPNVSQRPDYTQEELEFARKHGKKIIALRLKAQTELPDGFDLILSGRQYIDMADFDRGIGQLFAALGEPGPLPPAPPPSLWDRALRKVQRVRAVVANSDLGPTALKLGAAAVAGAAAVVAVAATINENKRRAALQEYRAAVENILGECLLQLALTDDMTIDDYMREFRPRAQRFLGQLEATTPPTDELKRHHADLVSNLHRTVGEYDEAVTKLERGDVGSARRAVTRLGAAFSKTLKSYTALLDRPS